MSISLKYKDYNEGSRLDVESIREVVRILPQLVLEVDRGVLRKVMTGDGGTLLEFGILDSFHLHHHLLFMSMWYNEGAIPLAVDILLSTGKHMAPCVVCQREGWGQCRVPKVVDVNGVCLSHARIHNLATREMFPGYDIDAWLPAGWVPFLCDSIKVGPLTRAFIS